jgi:DNA-binding transcriptional LysR family regulator
VTLDDLRGHRHLVIRDSGMQRTRSAGWLNEQRWTVSHKATSIHAVTRGYGYAWFPEESIRAELERGALVRVPLREGGEKHGFRAVNSLDFRFVAIRMRAHLPMNMMKPKQHTTQLMRLLNDADLETKIA